MRPLWLLLLAVPALAREWTREGGTTMKFQAELRGIDGPNLMLQAPDGRTAGFPLAEFSAADRDYVKARLPGLVLDAMTPPNVGQKDGAGWGRPLSADPADCAVSETADGFHSKHFAFKTSEKLPPTTQRDLAEACEVIHEIFRVAPWGVLATPRHEGRFQISLLPQSEIDADRNIFDKEGVLRIPFGAAGLEKIGGEWVRDERPGAGRNLKEFVACMLQRDVIGLVPPWLPDALADCIAEIPTIGGTAWCAEVPAGLQQKVESVPGPSLTILEELLAPPKPKPVEINDIKPLKPVVLPTLNRDGTTHAAPPAGEAGLDEKKQHQDHALIIAHYFTRLSDGRRAQPITRMLRQAMEDRPKWDAFDAALEKYHAEWEKLKKLPGAEKVDENSWRFPPGTQVPDEPKPPREYQNGDDLPWLLLPLLLEQKTPSAVAAEISALLAK
ncbi:MAG: hypothetical protein HS117_05125 [Verrucomicrobiaceae bacterium]|nr:hypothetical protein [Verrucomicrobiaceae bacterium]